MASIDINQRFGDANPIGLKEWFAQELVNLFRDFGTATKADDVAYIAGRVLTELKTNRRFDKLPIGFIGTGLKGILNGIYDVKKLSVQTILSSLVKEGNSLLPQGQGLDMEVTVKDYNRMYANAAKYGDPQAKGSVWSISLACSKNTSKGLRYLERKLDGFMAAAAIKAGLNPDVLVECSDAEFEQLKRELFPVAASYRSSFEQYEARRATNGRR